MIRNSGHTFYLDMDGVTADWARAAEQITGYRVADSNTHYPPADWEKIKNTERFYRDLPVMPGAEELVSLARIYRDELGWSLYFLTAVSHLNDTPWAFWDKMLWAQMNFPDIPAHFGPYSVDKFHHCRPGDILVDDRRDNCAQWRAAGGLAFEVIESNLESVIEQVSADLERRRAMVRLVRVNNIGRYLI